MCVETTKEIENRQLIEQFVNEYANKSEPIEVSFKEIVKDLGSIDRFTHLIHTYPAKLLCQIPHFFLNNTYFSKPGDTILDPFCGTGTVLLESILSNKNAIGIDINPLARLISTVKTSKFDQNLLVKKNQEIKKNIGLSTESHTPDVLNLDFWFHPNIQYQLGIILNSINAIKSKKYRDFFLVCFSNCVKKVSYADPRISVPVKLNPYRYKTNTKRYKQVSQKLDNIPKIDVYEKFSEIVKLNIKRTKEINWNGVKARAKVAGVDAKMFSTEKLTRNGINKNTIDLIITSPPYAGAQKYIRSSRLSLGWIELCKTKDIKQLIDKSIGREEFRVKEYENPKLTSIPAADVVLSEIHKIDPLRACICANYLIEMRDAFLECYKVLKNKGSLIVIVGNNEVCKKEFNTQQYFTEILTNIGFTLQFKLIDSIKSYGLMTKRNKSASIITREWILVFKKIA